MSLISDNQNKAAQVPTKPAPLPKPAKPAAAPAPRVVENAATSGYDEFAGGAGELGLEQALPETIAEPQAAPATPQSTPDEISQLTDVTRYMGGGAERVPLPQQTIPVAPPVNLWKDASVDFGANNLFSGDIVTTQSPTLYRSPIDTNSSSLASVAYANQDIAGKFAIDQERVRQQQAAARAAQAQVSQRASLPNVPDVDKPWHEQAVNGVLGFGKDFLFGTDQSNQAANTGEFNPLNGSYGVHGAGIGGALKATLSVPLGLIVAAGSEADKRLISVKNNIRDVTNPKVNVGGKQVQWNSLSGQQKLEYGVDEINRSTAWAKFPVLDSRTVNQSIGQKIGSVLTGKIVGDDIDNANRNLPGVIISRATGERVSTKERNGRTDAQLLEGGAYSAYTRATSKDKPTFYQARGRAPGQALTEDPASLAWSIVNQLASPGNKVDFVGNVIGELAGAVAKPVLKRVLGHSSQTQAIGKAGVEAVAQVTAKVTPQRADPNFGMGTVPANTPYKPKPKQAPPVVNPGLAPVSQPVRINALPANTLEQAFVNSPAAKVPRTAPGTPRLPAAPDPKLLTGGGDFIVPSLGSEVGLPRIRMNAELDPLVQEAYVINPLAKQGANTGEVGLPRVRMDAELDPRALPEGATQEAYIINPLAKRGSSEVGLPRVQMEARIEAPAIEGVPEQRLLPGAPATPSQVAAEVGIGTPGREITFDINGVTDNLAEITAKPKQQPLLPGTTGEALPALPAATVPRTLGELVEQSTTLASHRAVLDTVLGKLESVFDNTLDVGRRAVDELPSTPATVESLQQSLSVGAKLPEVAAEVLPKQLAEAVVTNDTGAIARAINDGELDDNTLQTIATRINETLDFSTTKVNRAAKPAKLATDVPATIYHGTALRNWSQNYNLRDKGSRGELGSGLYTTVNKNEAANYSRASVGENRSVDIAYDELDPQVIELSTAKLKSTLDARQPVAKPLVQQMLAETGVTMQEIISKGNLQSGTKPSYVDMVAAVERVAASKDSSEQGLQRTSRQISEALRKQGYDSVYDRQSGWVMVTDNLRLGQKKTKATGKPLATEAAVARYNADTKAAGTYADHITTDANLRDSAYKVLDQVRSEVDEKLGQVQQEAIAKITKEEVRPVAEVDQAVSNSLATVLTAEFDEAVAVTTAQIKQYGMSAEPLLVRQEGSTFKIVGNAHVAEAARNSNLTSVNAVVVGGRGKRGHFNVDLAKVVNGSNIENLPTTTAEVAKAVKANEPQRVFPIVQLSDDGEFYTVVSKDWAVSAFKETGDAIGVYQLYKGKLSYNSVDVSLVKSIDSDVVPKPALKSRQERIVDYLEIKDNAKLLSDSQNKVDDLRSYVDELIQAKAPADEIDEAVVAAQKQEIAHQANTIRYSSDHIPNVEKALADAKEAIKLKVADLPQANKRSQTIVNNLRIDKPEQRLLVGNAERLLDNAKANIDKSELDSLVRGFEAAKYQYDNLVGDAVAKPPELKGKNVALEDVVAAAKAEVATNGVLSDDYLNRIYRATVDSSSTVGMRDEDWSKPGLALVHELYSSTPLGFKAAKDGKWLEEIISKHVKENALMQKVMQPAPVNPHGNVKEMLDNIVDDICNF